MTRQKKITVEELQEKLEMADNVINWQHEEMERMRQQYSVLISKEQYDALQKRYDSLKAQYEDLRKLYDNLKANKSTSKHNERGAGRKPKATDQDKELIRERAAAGSSIRQLAKEFELSIGTVHKIISEQ